MKKYYEVHVRMTGKAIGSKEAMGHGYSGFGREKEQFETLAEVKTYLKEKYGSHRREKMFVDGNDSHSSGFTPIHVGYIYKFKNSDHENKWYQQDWVEVKEIKATTIIV